MNLSCPVRYIATSKAVKRIMREAIELKSASNEFFAQPLDNDIFEWHFTIKGAPNSEFENGFYHGLITLPSDYPMSPPSVYILTPNGRFEVKTKICFSASYYQPETWQPSWSIRTLLVDLIAFMPTPANGVIGSMGTSPQQRRWLASKSKFWACARCGYIAQHFSQVPPSQTCSRQRQSQENTSMDLPAPEVPSFLFVVKWLLLILIFGLLFRRVFVL